VPCLFYLYGVELPTSYIHSRRSSYDIIEAAAKREAQLQAKKDADEKRRLAADGE